MNVIHETAVLQQPILLEVSPFVMGVAEKFRLGWRGRGRGGEGVTEQIFCRTPLFLTLYFCTNSRKLSNLKVWYIFAFIYF